MDELRPHTAALRCALLGASILLVAECVGGAHNSSASAHRRARHEILSTPGTANAQPDNDIVAENSRTGTTDWRIHRVARPHEIEGWADQVSVIAGETVRLYVSTTAHSYTVSGFRTGWYGGAEAALIYRSQRLQGSVQRPSRLDSSTRTVLTSWSASVTVDTHGWPPGDYLFRLDADTGGQEYIPLAVRSTSNVGRIVILNAVTTWQAYNGWGGYDLYNGPGGLADFVHRSRAVSFDRPYGGDGAGEFIGNELPLVALAERLGLPVSYATDIDLHADPALLNGARALISLGHDEYWSSAMRLAATNARDDGMNIAFLGANAVFRHIRLAQTRYGANRLEICYKRANEDPLYHKMNREVTVDWREPPTSKPESVLTGVYYESNPVTADMVIVDPDSWLFEGLGLRAGERLPRLVGHEYDRVNPGAPTPRPIEVLSHSPLVCRGVRSFSDAAYYSTPNGAGVFATGTNLWVASLDPTGPTDPLTQRVVTEVTTRVLRTFGAGPAGQPHPAQDNLAGFREYAGDPIAARVNLH